MSSPEGRKHHISMHITVILITSMVMRRHNLSVSNDEFFEVVALHRKLCKGCSSDEDATKLYYKALWMDAHGKEQYNESKVIISGISSYPKNTEWLAKVEGRYKKGIGGFTRIPSGRATAHLRSIKEAPRSAPSPKGSVLMAVNLDQVLDDKNTSTANTYCNTLAPYLEWAAHSKEACTQSRLQNRDIREFNKLLKTTIIDRRHQH